MGAQMAKQSKRLGVHFTFGPVVDINTNPKQSNYWKWVFLEKIN